MLRRFLTISLLLGFAVVLPQSLAAQSAESSARTVSTQAQMKAMPKAMVATPARTKNFIEKSRSLSMGSDDPRYTCDYKNGKPTSCWCNWSKDAADCADFVLSNPCGNGSCWTSNVPGEYGCDCQN